MQPARDHLLVVLHRLDDLAPGHVGHRRQRSKARDEIGQRLAVSIGKRPPRSRQRRHDEHAVGNRFAVSVPAILRHGFQRVSCRVTEVQHSPRARFSFVGRDDRGFDAARFGDDRGQGGRRALENGLPLGRDAVEQRRARGHAVLDDFVQARAELPAGQCRQHQRIDDDGVRLIEGSNQVLAERVVDAHLPADRRVHLRQERRRHVHQRNPPQVRGGSEAGHVADHPAAEGDEGRVALRVRLDERIVDARNRRQMLVALTVADENRRLRIAQGPRDLVAMKPPDDRARHHEPACRRFRLVQQAPDVVQRTVADGHCIGAGRRGDVDTNGIHARRVG